MLEALQPAITNLAVIVITGVIGLVGTYATMLIQKAKVKMEEESKNIQDKNAQMLIKQALDNTMELVNVNVIKANETLVKEIKDKAQDGVIDREELKQVGVTVKTEVLDQLPEKTYQLLNSTIGDVSKYVEGLIEKSLVEIKRHHKIYIK